MIKLKYLIVIFILTSACSTNDKSGFWKKSNEITVETKEELLFKKSKLFDKEFNKNIRINLSQSFQKYKYSENISNNYKIQNYDGILKEKKKYKFKKINDLNVLSSDILFTKNDNVVFFDKLGSIFLLDQNLNLKWKKNFYSKKEKKIEPLLNFALVGDNILVADNLGYIYSINEFNGDLIWKKKNDAAFNSNIKIKHNSFYVVDFNNVLKSFSTKNGSLNWKYQSENTLIKSKKKLSLVINKNKIIFINTVGDINALNVLDGNLIWQTPTQKTTIYQDSFSINYSDLVSDEKSVFFSNTENEIFSIDLITGNVIWKQNINSSVRPSIIDDLLFTITSNGFFVILDKKNGNIIRSTNLRNSINNLGKKTQVVGFLIAKKFLYLTLSNGKMLKINILNGEVEKVYNLDNSLISKPFIYKKKLYIISNNTIKNFD